MNTVQYIIQNRPLSHEEKVTVKALGRPTPDLQIQKIVNCKTRDFRRYFNKDKAYGKFSWMCGCEKANKLFCFICLLSNESKPSWWITEGVNELKHLVNRASKHEISASHLQNSVDYNLLGKANIYKQLDPAYAIHIREHNEKVNENRHMLRRLIKCVKFCGAFEFALRGYDEGTEPEIQCVFQNLVDFASELHNALSDHLKDTTLFKGASKTIQSELLDAMLQVCKDEILQQISKSNFVAIEVDETTDSFNQQQLVIILRYVFEGEIFERFWGFIQPTLYTTEGIANAILKELEALAIPANKLIAQSYDGTSAIRGEAEGVQLIIRQKYPAAFPVHCYTHDVSLLLEKAASCDKKLKIFFAEVKSFATFFVQRSKSTLVLDETVKKELPVATSTEWNFKARAISTLHEKKYFIRECLEKILDSENNSKTISEANGLLTVLQSTDFNYFLEVLYYIMPYVEMFLIQLQLREADSLYIQARLEKFESQIIDIRETIDSLRKGSDNDLEASTSKRPRLAEISENNRAIAKEYCDVLLSQIKCRYDFTGHLSAADLFSADAINSYKKHFPEDSFKSTVEAYPFIDENKLKAELSVIYHRDDIRWDGILPFLTFINKIDLQEGLSETYKLLDILCTTPMITCESERCFPTLKRIKYFLRNAAGQERLNALAMLSIEKKLVQSIDDFDDKVVSVFTSSEDRRMDFSYK